MFRMLLIGRESSVKQARAAHLIPVVGQIVESGISLVIGRHKTFFHDGLFCCLPLRRSHMVIKPVITDRYSHDHLAHIQEMARIPVRECTDRKHFIYGAVGIGLISGHPV